MNPATRHELPPRPDTQVALRNVTRSIPGLYLTVPSKPPGWRREVRIQHDRPGRELVGVEPMVPAAVVDGVQSRVLLTLREGRPLLLEYVGAAAVGPHRRTLVGVEDRLYLAGSHLDAEYLRSLPEGLPVVELDGISPAVVATEAMETIQFFRQRLEATVAVLAGASGEPVVVDGSVRHLEGLAGPAIGVIKNTASTQWLTDESELASLDVGWRSTVFVLPAQRRGEHTVHCCYLRLHRVPRSTSFTEGLIRLESTDPDLLDPAAAWAMRSRQAPGSDDPRWATHLAPVRDVELYLKGRRPQTSLVTR